MMDMKLMLAFALLAVAQAQNCAGCSGSCLQLYNGAPLTCFTTWNHEQTCLDYAQVQATSQPTHPTQYQWCPLVADVTPPTLSSSQPASSTVSCESIPAVPSLAFTDDVSAPQDINVVYTATTTTFSCADNYQIVRQWVATDEAGNSANVRQTIVSEDSTAPALQNVPASFSQSVCDAIPSVPTTVTTSDNCDASPVMTVEEVSGTNSVTRKWTATDACGNVAEQTQVISRTPEDCGACGKVSCAGGCVEIDKKNDSYRCMNSLGAGWWSIDWVCAHYATVTADAIFPIGYASCYN